MTDQFWNLCLWAASFSQLDIMIATTIMGISGILLCFWIAWKHLVHYNKTNQDRKVFGAIGHFGMLIFTMLNIFAVYWQAVNLSFNHHAIDPPASVSLHTCPNCNHVLEIERVDENDEY